MANRFTDSYTLNGFIESGKKASITYDKFSTLEILGKIKFPLYHVIDDYLKELKNISVTVELNSTEYYKYRYRPKLLAYDVYGHIELDFIILAINNLADMKEFNMRTIKMLKKADLIDVLSYIYNAEKEFINSNRN